MSGARPRKWMKLDNAAKIYPAAMSRSWNALFRVSAVLSEPVDPAILQKALDRCMKRFPTFAMRLRRGVFWYYMDTIDTPLSVQPDVANPCVRMELHGEKDYMLRVRYHDCSIAVEFFHVLTDGNGGLLFLKTLTAEYLTLKYGAVIPRNGDILDCDQTPTPDETGDSFLKYARSGTRSRSEARAYKIPGTDCRHMMHITTGMLDSAKTNALAKEMGATVTELLTAVLIQSVQELQEKKVPLRRNMKPVKICVPINLRKYYPTCTVRNFASYMNPGIDPALGHYSLKETLRAVRGYMALENDEKLLNAKFSTNVAQEKNIALRLVPLGLKSAIMKSVFILQGETLTSSTVSNLGICTLPPEMSRYVKSVYFLLGPLYRNRVACACVSYNGKLNISFTRSIEESDIERGFFTRLVRLGLHVTVESNTYSLQNAFSYAALSPEELL